MGLVQYYVVNSELSMSKGKVAAQVAHVATGIALKYKEDSNFKKWYENGQTKVILRGKEKDLLKLIDSGFEHIRDNGHTEIPEGSLTVVGLPPMPKKEAKKYIKRLQVLKEEKNTNQEEISFQYVKEQVTTTLKNYETKFGKTTEEHVASFPDYDYEGSPEEKDWYKIAIYFGILSLSEKEN